MPRPSPFRYFKTSPKVIRLAVMLSIRFPLSLRHVEDLLHERGIEVSHEMVRYWWSRFGLMFAVEICSSHDERTRAHCMWWRHCQRNFVRQGAGAVGVL